jgi:AAHS family 4-hydroxybenzoate transporter-like MFS transporter
MKHLALTAEYRVGYGYQVTRELRLEVTNMSGIGGLDRALDSTKITAFQSAIIGLCALMAMIDGMDTQAIGLVAPAIASDWHVPAAAFGPVFGSSLFCGLIGALVAGQAGDRFGRKPILIFSIVVFALGSLATPLTHSISGLLIVRLVTGFGLGGALPIIISITSEFSPKRLRLNIVALMYCGFPFGSVLGGVLAAQLIPRFGWASIFYIGGVVPSILLPMVALIMPESLSFLAMNGKRDKVEALSRRLGLQIDDLTVAQSKPQARATVRRLFAEDRAIGTLLLWTTLFLSLLLTVFLVSWMPLVTHQAGLGIKSAVLGVAALNLGGIAGCFFIGWISKRFRSIVPIAVAYALGGVAVGLIGLVVQSGQILLTVAFVAGILTVGSQMCAVALSASFYESAMRSTGVGWALGIGRIGAVIGPVIGGILIAQHVTTPTLFMIAGAVSLGAGAAVFGIARIIRRRNPGQFFTTPAMGQNSGSGFDRPAKPPLQIVRS